MSRKVPSPTHKNQTGNPSAIQFPQKTGSHAGHRSKSVHPSMAAIFEREGQELGAALMLSELYNQYRSESFEDAMCHFNNLHELIRHNPELKEMAEAMRQMIEGEKVLNQFAAKMAAI